MELLRKWAPFDSKEISDIADPLFLLSSFTIANDLYDKRRNKRPRECMKKIRMYAVDALQVFSDDQIESVLLQLVSALKYEDTHDKSPLSAFLFERATKKRSLSVLLYWYLHVEQDIQLKEGRTQITNWYQKLFEGRKPPFSFLSIPLPSEFDETLKNDNEELYEEIQSQVKFRSKLQQLSRTIR